MHACSELLSESESRYVRWMSAYEMPAFAALADRMRSVGDRVSKHEMALFVRRQGPILLSLPTVPTYLPTHLPTYLST